MFVDFLNDVSCFLSRFMCMYTSLCRHPWRTTMLLLSPANGWLRVD